LLIAAICAMALLRWSRIVDAGFGIGAQVLNSLRRRVELLRHGPRGIDDTDPRLRVWAGRQAWSAVRKY
jgi:hypothetical protein